MHLVVISLLIQLMVTTFALWLAMKLTKEEGPFIGLLASAFVASLAGLLPIPYYIVFMSEGAVRTAVIRY